MVLELKSGRGRETEKVREENKHSRKVSVR
jgi:hypothetical protein